MKVLASSLSLLIFLYACDNGLNDPSFESKTKKVSFYSSISNSYKSRAVDAAWESNDRIGVYMLNSSDKRIIDSNSSYITLQGNGNFDPVGNGLYYPADESYVDFIAYYPYQESISSNIYKVNVSDQSAQKNIDLMYSTNLTERNSKSVKGHLQFYHQLSRLNIQFSTTDNTDLSSIRATIKGVPTQADFNLTDGKLTIQENSKADVNMYHSGTVAQAILLPSTDVKGIKILLTQNGKTKEVTLPTSISSFEAGFNYSINVTVKNGSINVPEDATYAAWRETPVISKDMLAKSNIEYINHYMPNDNSVRNYSLLYDKDLKIAYWIAYPYCSYYGGHVGRTDAWGFDPKVESKYQIDYALGSYGSGYYDRGHQIPSGDRQRDRESNATTFYATNMTPQTGKKLNQSIWADLENKVRAWSSGTDTIFVVTGASPTTATDKTIKYTTHRKTGAQVAVPKYYYKALARKIGGQFHTIAFKLDQKEYNDRNFMQYAISVSELEKITGFTFFPSIDVAIKEKLETNLWK